MFQNLLGKNSASRKTRIFFILILAASPCNAEDRQSLLYSRDLLYAHDFSALDTRLKQTNDDYLAGQLSTRDYYAVFQTLWIKKDIETQANSALEGHLNQWLASTQSAYALAALGKFYARLGYKQRGGKWSTETSKDQFINMRASFRRAQELLAQSQDLDNHILFAYLTMANIQKSLPNTPKNNQTHKNKRSFEEMAFAILPTPIQTIITYFFPSRANTPRTYQTSTRLEVFQSPFFEKAPQQIWEREAIWNDILFNATPRWGGSYTEMQFIIDHDIPQYYPEFNTNNQRYFESWIIEDKLRVLYRAKKYEEGQQQAQHAINNGSVSAGMYKQAIYLAKKTKRFDDCYNYAKHLTEKRPWRVKNWDNLGVCAFKLQRWEDMNTAYQHAIYLDGETKYRLYQLGISYMYLHEYAKAYPLFISAKALDPDYAKYTDQYTQYIEDKKPEARSLEKLSAIDIIGVLHYIPEQ